MLTVDNWASGDGGHSSDERQGARDPQQQREQAHQIGREPARHGVLCCAGTLLVPFAASS